MLTKNRITRAVLLGLVVLSVLLIAFAIDTPKPVYAEAKYPCYGYVCIDLIDDWRVSTCIILEKGNAWYCTNYCYNGQWFCAGSYDCRGNC